MAWVFKNLDDVLEFFTWARDRAPDDFSWFLEHTPNLFPTPLSATDFRPALIDAALQSYSNSADAAAGGHGEGAIAILTAPLGSPGADASALDYAALLAAAAQTPAALDLSVGTAPPPQWLAPANLDGVQVGEALQLLLGAAHAAELQSALLA
jgi:hypothetical protein